jgi:hypothetical protein
MFYGDVRIPSGLLSDHGGRAVSLTNPFLQKYRAEKKDFRHETATDQFFDERQFEAYRALGESIGRGSPKISNLPTLSGLWLHKLAIGLWKAVSTANCLAFGALST